MSGDACLHWLSLQLNRPAEAIDLYAAGKSLYQQGRYLGASKLLQLYTESPGNELPGHHLLAYAYMHCDDKRRAVAHARRVVNSGFDADWQLICELQVDLDRQDGLLPPPAENVEAPK